MADAITSVLKYLKVEQAILIGHSMGGYVALAFAEKNPLSVLGLCLVNSTSKDDSSERKKNRDRAIILVKQNYKSFVRTSITNLFRPKNRILFSEKIKAVKEEALKTPLQGVIAALEGMKIRKNREPVLQNASYKKLMIISKKDPVLNYDDLVNECKKNKVDMIEFPDGHMSYIENESLFLQEILYFIEKK